MYKLKKCKECGKDFKQYNSLQKCPCAGMKLKTPIRKTKIKPISDKRKVQDAEYQLKRVLFLKKPENQICPITGHQAVEVHHKWSGKDRSKYYLDETTWLAVSRAGHNWIHDNPKEAREKGYLY